MEQERIHSFGDIEKRFNQEGYLVLGEGTPYTLELVYIPSNQEEVYVDVRGEKILQPKGRRYVTYPGLQLKEPILVGRYVSYLSGGEKKGEYKFPLINPKIVDLERESADFQSLLFSARRKSLEEQNEGENPYVKAISEERDRLNKEFVTSILGEDVDLNDLTGVRIVTEL